MKAIRIQHFGGPEVLKLEEIPEPQPGMGEIRIRVIAAGVNPIDWKIREGMRDIALPLTMGVDISGVVDLVGAQVDKFHSGDRVFAKANPEQGGYAEYTVVQAKQAAQMPQHFGFVEAAAIPTAGLTAWQALFDTAGLQSGQSVLIHGAAGGVGSFAVQFARWKGAHIIGTASSTQFAFVKSLGADEVIDYTRQRFEEVAHDLDVVLDTIGGDTFMRSWQVLKPGGFLVSIVNPIPAGEAEKRGVRAQFLVSQNKGDELAQIAALIDEGHVKPMVTEVLPLTEARQAQEDSESHHAHGKIVLRVAEDRGRNGGS